MKTKILLVIIICLPFFAKAQITITTQLPGSGMLLKEQLWNLVIINNSNDIAELKLQVDVRDMLLGQSVINASAGKLVIGKGMKLITVKDVQPVMYNYVATEFSGNYLPCGSYTINYRLIQETIKGDVPVADEVVKINVTPLSPPLLTTPADKSSIETVYPQFTWMPPAPMQMFNPLLYDITVVAVEEGQAAKEAMEFNKPVYVNTNLQNPAEKMPTSFQQLQQGKAYAWQVVARSGNSCAAPTEVFMFTIGKDTIAKIIDQAPYIKVSKSNTEVAIIYEGVIKMEYNNTAGDKKVKFNVYKVSDRAKENKNAIQFEIELTNGQNFLSYNIAKKAALDDKTVYEISMINSRGEEWLMRFTPVYYKK